MDPFNPSSDWSTIIQMLKADDEMLVYQGAMTLRDSLQYAQENQMHGFMTEQFMDILVKIVNKEMMSDLGLEVKYFAIQSLTTIMDIFPSLVNNLVNAGLVKGMTSVMQQSVGFIELSESCIKCLEKVVQENPPAVLKSGAITVVLDQLPFFVQSTQRRIFKILLKIARHSSNENDFDKHLMPVLPFIMMNLSEDNLINDISKFEDASKIVFEMQESFVLFLSPTHDFKKVGEQYDKLSREGLYDIILEHIRRHCDEFTRKYANQAKKVGNSQASKDPMLRDLMLDKQDSDLNQIASSGSEGSIPHQIIQSYLKILENGCRYSINVSNKLFGQTNMIQNLGCFLPSEYLSSGGKHQYNSDDFPFINETINLLNSTLSDKAEEPEQKSKLDENDDDGDSIMKGDNSKVEEKDKIDEKQEKEDKEAAIANLPPHIRRRVFQQEFQAQKREFQIKEENKNKIVVLAEIILPRVFYVYEIMINPQIRIKTLQLIDKIIALFDDELLQNFIKPKQFANFIYQIIRSKHIFSIEMCLRMTKKIIDCSPLNYSVPFIREGVSSMIEQFSDESKLKQFMGIRQDIDIFEGQFDIEIHSLKEALNYQRVNHPEDHQTRDFYERTLLELVDRQRHIQQLQAQEKAETAKLTVLGQKIAKKVSHPKFNSFGSYPEKQNILPKIINICKQLTSDYFQNKEFLQKLEQHSDKNREQLSIFKQLSDISEKLSEESTKQFLNINDSDNLQALINKLCILLVQQGSSALTSHEFKDSGLLNSLELLLTKPPVLAKYLIEKKRLEVDGAKLKHSDEIYLNELKQKSQGSISREDGISVMNRLKLFVHLLLIKQKAISPMDGLLEINHKVISENNSFMTQAPVPQIDHSTTVHGFGAPPGFIRDNFSQGDYDHCINALKQLQKRVTVNLIYDPNKQFKDPNHSISLSSVAKEKKDQSSNPFLNSSSFIRSILEQEKQAKQGAGQPAKPSEKDKDKPKDSKDKDADKQSDNENSHMEDLSEVKPSDEDKDKVEEKDKVDNKKSSDQNQKSSLEQIIDKQEDQSPINPPDIKDDGLGIKKTQTQMMPQQLRQLAGSPSKQQVILEIEKQNLNSSKVYMKRHFLYNEISQIPVTVEQSSCLQILEDFLRNKIKSIEDVKLLKRDYGYGGMHSYKDPWSGAPPDLNSASPFDQVLGGGSYQSITQKILRKNLGSEARKVLDQANNRLARILNTGSGIKIAQRKRRARRHKKQKQEDSKDKMKDDNDDEKEDKIESKQEDKVESKDEDKIEEAPDKQQKEKDKKEENDNEDKELKSDRSKSKSYGSHLDDDDEGSNSEYDENHGLDDSYDNEDMIKEHDDDFDEDKEVVAVSHSEPLNPDEEEEKHRQLEQFIQELPDEIINSSIPDDQQYMLVKILTRQHTFMMGYLEMNIQEGGGGPSDEEMYKFEQKLEDFQETMEAVQARFLSLKDIQTNKKKQKKQDEKKSAEKGKLQEDNDTSRDDNQTIKQQSIQEILIQAKQSIQKDKDSDQEMVIEEPKPEQSKEDKVEGSPEKDKKEISDNKEDNPNKLEQKNEDASKSQDLSHPQVKLNIKQNDAEMMKPADVSDSENIEDGETLIKKETNEDKDKKLKSALAESNEKMEEEIDLNNAILPNLKKENRTESEIVLEKKKEEQEILVQRALQKDRENLMRLKAQIEEKEHGKINVAENSISEQTVDVINQDLEKLIKEEGEDTEFEFYYEHKQIALNQTIFEITKNVDTSKRYSEKAQIHAEQMRVLKEKEEELKARAKEIASIKDKEKEKENEEKIAQLKNDYTMIREIFNQIQKQYDAESKGGGDFSYFSGHGPPPGFLSSFGHVHRIYFRIKDKNDEITSNRKRSRIDSLSDVALSEFKRSRTKSEAVQDMSGASIKTFIEQILFKEFQVFDKQEEHIEEKKPKEELPKPSIDQKKLDEIKGKMKLDPKILVDEKDNSGAELRKQQERKEKVILESSLKILKVINFIYTNHDIISERGMRFVMEGYEYDQNQSKDSTMQSSLAPEDLQLNDASLQLGFADLQSNLFHNQKLDTYLQKSIKDPYNLVQGISPEMQQVFKNCPYLFPFQTKLLYFKLVSFISAIDVHRSIYFLRQYLRQHSGVNQQLKDHEKDNLKKITRQKVVINRNKILESAFSLIQKIDKRNFLEVSFENEEGTGLGPTLEFYDNIAEGFQKWQTNINEKIKDFKMWRKVGNGDLFPTPICLKTFDQAKIKQIYEIFRLCGTIIAKAIVDDRQIDMPISPIFWKICLGQQMTIFDYQLLETSEDGATINQEKFHMLADFQILFNQSQLIEEDFKSDKISEDERKKKLENLKTSRGMKVDDYFMTFTLPEPYSYVELIQKGSTMDVTLESAQDFVDLVLHYTFHESIKIQVQAFKKGFNSIFPISSLQPFVHASSKGDEIQQIICGQPCQGPEWTNPEELMKYIEPDHGYTKKSEPYQYFIRYITELQPSERPGFLKFLTGSKRLPLGGFRNLQPNLTFVKKAQGIEQGVVERDINLPSCNTCFNYVKCPPYTSYQVLKHKFDQAFAFGQGNFSFS